MYLITYLGTIFISLIVRRSRALTPWLYIYTLTFIFSLLPGRLRPRPRVKTWHYRYIGRYKSLTPRRLGRYVGRMRGRKKVFECARRAKRMRYRAFALRNRGDCYVSRYSSTYSTKKRLFGRFKGSSGQPRAIDAYVIGKGKSERLWQGLVYHEEKMPFLQSKSF